MSSSGSQLAQPANILLSDPAMEPTGPPPPLKPLTVEHSRMLEAQLQECREVAQAQNEQIEELHQDVSQLRDLVETLQLQMNSMLYNGCR